MIFHKKGKEKHQCHAMKVTLKNGPLDRHPQVHGTYQLLAVTVNGHPSWTSSTHAIWYSIDSKQWVIGPFSSLGSVNGIFSGCEQDKNYLMPCEQNGWMYRNYRFKEWQKPNGYGLLYNDNDINIQCRGNV